MRYFVPDLRLSTDLPPQDKLEDKLGGLPWGLKPEQLPVCSCCGKHQSLLAQLVHHPQRLDLGATGRVLFVFQCNNLGCNGYTWEGDSGANTCFVLDADQLTEGITPMPTSIILDTEVRVAQWFALEDGVSPDEVALYYDSEKYFALTKEKQIELCGKVPLITKFGSVPLFQYFDEAPGKDWVYVGQLYNSYDFFEEPSDKTNVYVYSPSYLEGLRQGIRWYCSDGPNFGDNGVGYIFLRYQAEKTDCWFFWQEW